MQHIKISTDIIMCIEACNISRGDTLELNIKGWAFSRKSKQPLIIEILGIQKDKIQTIKSIRQDIFRRYLRYEGALNSGFTIKIKGIENIPNIKLKFKDKDNGGSRIHNINLHGLLNHKRVSATAKKSLKIRKPTERLVNNLKEEEVRNNKKICFITCVNDREKYDKALRYINSLQVPNGYKIEKICINDAKYLTEAYNTAMKKTDAKYKVYMHQDVYITNPTFISDIINVFNKSKSIGMIGMAGAKTMPSDGVLHHSNNKYGNLIHIPYPDGKEVHWKYGNFKNEYETVKAIDGLMMITQYDVPWREDIFTGWHFYDISQSIEFIKSGYEIAVPNMKEIWCIHDCPKSEHERNKNYDKYRKIFVDKYGKYLD